MYSELEFFKQRERIRPTFEHDLLYSHLKVFPNYIEHFLMPYTKINPEIKYLNVRPETIKFLQENVGRTLDGINQSNILYDPSQGNGNKNKNKEVGPN